MRRFILLLSSFLMISFLGCNKDGGLPPYIYDLKISFENSSGDNLVKGLKYDPTTAVTMRDGARFQIQRVEYKQMMQGKYSLSPDEPLWIEIKDNGDESLFMRNITFDHVTPTITHRLICPHIFGDDKEHVIVSYWERTPNYESRCLKVTFDGKESPVTNVEKKDYVFEVLIRVDRP